MNFKEGVKAMSQNKDYAFVVDSTTALNKDITDIVRVEKVSLSITVENLNKPENEWTSEEIAQALKENKNVHSACPSPAEFAQAYEKLFDEGYKDILVLPMNKSISHTYESAVMGRQVLDEEKQKHVVVLELFEANYGLALLVAILAKYSEQGFTFEQVVVKAKEIAPTFHECWTLSTLEPLYKGGRLSRFSFIVGAFLKIKPIIGINETKGSLEAEKKVRTFNDVDKYFLDKIAEAMNKFKHVYMSFVHMGEDDLTNNLIKKVTDLYPDLDYIVFDGVGPLFTVHLGDAGYGIGFIGEGLKNENPTNKEESIPTKIIKLFKKDK